MELTFAFSAIYELIEWGAAITVDPQAGLAFLGSQGDVWDAQKDMFLAGIGALISMTIVLVINAIYKKDFAKDFVQSLRVGKIPLGEVELAKMIEQKK